MRILKWIERWLSHYRTERDLRRGKVLYGRQPAGVQDHDEITVTAHNPQVEMRQRVRVTAKVFRAATGSYEDLGEVASTDRGNAHVVHDPRD